MGRARRRLRVFTAGEVTLHVVGLVYPTVKAKLLLLAVATLALAGCGSGHARALRSARPTPKVLVYAKAPPSRDLMPRTENVWRANVDGRHPKLIAKDSTDPTVSPDGRLIAYDNGGNVLVVPAAGGKPRIVYHYGEGPAWAPDSRHLAVSGSDNLSYIVDVRTGSSKAIDAASISFSPDSKRIVYGTVLGDLYVTSIDGSRPVQITHDRKSFGPVWGPKGIAFVRFTHGVHGDIWLTGPRPKDAHQLTHADAYIWPVSFSGDGTELLAAYPAFHNGRIWAVDVPSGHARPITPWVGDLSAQGLSTDGKTVLAAVGCGGTPSPYGVIETIPFAGGKPDIITRGPCRASWNAG